MGDSTRAKEARAAPSMKLSLGFTYAERVNIRQLLASLCVTAHKRRARVRRSNSVEDLARSSSGVAHREWTDRLDFGE